MPDPVFIYILIWSKEEIQWVEVSKLSAQYLVLSTHIGYSYGYWCIVNLGLMIHQHSTCRAKKNPFKWRQKEK